jgi:hypothetical protein
MGWWRWTSAALELPVMGDFTTLLFARPSFFEGAARILDFGNTLTEYNTSESPAEADSRAMLADWKAIRGDMLKALATLDVKKVRTK